MCDRDNQDTTAMTSGMLGAKNGGGSPVLVLLLSVVAIFSAYASTA